MADAFCANRETDTGDVTVNGISRQHVTDDKVLAVLEAILCEARLIRIHLAEITELEITPDEIEENHE